MESTRLDGDEDLVATRPETPTRRHRVAATQGERIGRYIVLELLGSGGMGVVYRVYDPELDREVALKLLLVGTRSGGDTHGRRARLLREAQALAQLAHPNVVSVFDVGTIDGDPYIAMEYIDGRTLRSWLEIPRTWQEIVGVFIDAGRGLIAAHEQGIIHRDFKLDNVLVGRDGRARVLDFGLARPVESSLLHSPVSTDFESIPISVADSLTRDGVVMGTPKSMSPEQHVGVVADARSDQFSFCVALFEALWKVAPYEGKRLSELSRLKHEGRHTAIPGGTGEPGALRRAVRRGLAPRPEDRWPSVAALLHALERARRPSRRGPAVLAIGALALGGWWLLHDSADEPCAAGDPLAGVWDAARIEEGHQAFVATNLPYAEDTWSRASELVDHYAVRWATAYADACARSATDPEAADLTMACLGRRRTEIDALATAFLDADARVVEHAVQAATDLDPLDECTRAAHDDGAEPPPLDIAGAVERESARLLEAAALQSTGKYEEALAIAEEVGDVADDLGYAPLQAAAELRIGLLRSALAMPARAEIALTDAYLGAQEHGEPDVALHAAIALVLVLGRDLSRFDDAHQWARHAEAWLARGEVDVEARQAELDSNVGALLRAEGKYEPALLRYRAALQRREALYGPEHPLVAASIADSAQVLHELGRAHEAVPELERALDLRRRALGPEHPDVARSLAALGYELYIVGRAEEAVDAQEAALEILRRVLPKDHPEIAESLSNLGISLSLLGRMEEALRCEREALEIRRASLGETHPAVASSLSSLGMTLQWRWC